VFEGVFESVEGDDAVEELDGAVVEPGGGATPAALAIWASAEGALGPSTPCASSFLPKIFS